jgi:hypothetical protein
LGAVLFVLPASDLNDLGLRSVNRCPPSRLSGNPFGHAFHRGVHNPQVENILLGQMLKVGQRRVVRCYQKGVVELVCQRPFQVSEATEVNHPAPVIASTLPSDFDDAVVAVDPTAMTVVFPLAMSARIPG